MATIQIRPQPLGLVTVTAPGTPVQLITNGLSGGSLSLAEPWGVPSMAVNSLVAEDAFARRIDLKAPTDIGAGSAFNKGRIYIGMKTMVRATLVGVIWILDPGDTYTLENSQQPMPYHMADYWIDADNAGDGVLGFFDPS
jgi:hypothetical protein